MDKTNVQSALNAILTLKETFGDKTMSEIESELKGQIEKDVKLYYFEPDVGDKYWFLGGEGSIDQLTWIGFEEDALDSGAYDLGNCYRTKEDAEKAKARQLAIVKINRLIDEANNKYQAGVMKGSSHYYIYYVVNAMEFCVACNFSNTLDTRILIYCNDETELRKIINENKKDLKIIFEID